MGLAEEVARIILEAQTKGFEEAKQKLEKVEVEVYDLADSYELVEQAQTRFVTAATKVERGFDWTQIVSPKMRRMTEDFDFATIKLNKGVAGVEKAAQGAKRGISGLQQQITAGSYAFQDFTATSGDLGAKLNSVSNNLPTLLMGLGGLGTVISISGTAAIALYKNWDSVTSLFETRHPFPKTAQDLDGMKTKLHDVSEAIKKLREQGSVNDAGLARFNELQKEEAGLKAAIKVREKVDHLKEEKSAAEEQVAKAFAEALKETGAKKSLETLEKDLKSDANPATKDLFVKIFTKIEKGNLDAFNALMDYAKSNPEKYGNLAREMESELKKAFKQDGGLGPMDDVAKKHNEERKKFVVDLNKQGLDAQREMVEEMAKEAKDGTLAIVKEPLEALVIKGRAMGVVVGKEVSHLKNEAEAEAERLYPQLKKMFPKAFEGVVNGMVLAVRESVDKTIEQLQAAEGLTKQEAIRRLNQKRQEKGQANAEGLALDEFTEAAARDYRKKAAVTPGMAPLTPEMAKQMGQQTQDRMNKAGVSGRGQVAIGAAMNTRGGERAIEEAMDALGAAGFDEAEAMRLLPNVLSQIASGREAPQAVDQVVNERIRQQGNAQNRAAARAARPRARLGQGGRAPAGRGGGGGGFRSVAPEAPGGATPGQAGVGPIAEQVGQGLGVQQETQQVVADTQGLVVQLANQVQRVAAGNAQLQAENRRIRQFMQQPGPTNLPGGQ
jgi:hypothetical protein